MKYVTNLDLNKNELRNAVIQPLASAPANPKEGQIYYNSTDSYIYRYNGTAWGPIGVVYSQGSTTGAVVTGLGADGTVTTNNVIDLTLTGYTPATNPHVTAGMTLQQAMVALENAINSKAAQSDLDAEEQARIDADDALNERIDDISAIGRFLSYWNCATGKPVTEPTSLPYTYHTGDYFVVNTVASGGATNYKPDGTTYTGAASTVAETAAVAPQDIYRFDGSVWSLSKNTGPDLSGYVATFSQTFTTEQKAQARTNIGAGTSSFSGSYDDLTNKPTITQNGTTTKTPSFYAPTTAGTLGQVLTSNGTGAPTWQAAPESVHKYTAQNTTLTSSGGVWTWTITAATHGINNASMFVALYEVSGGAQVMCDVYVNPSNYAITINIIDSASVGSLAADTYRVVAIG